MLVEFPDQLLSPLEELLAIAQVTESDALAAVERWEQLIGEPFKQLLQAEPREDAPPKFYYNRKSQRYQYKESGRFVSEATVKRLTLELIDLLNGDLDTIGDLLVRKRISLATWEETTATTLKQLHVQEYVLGRGGIKNMTARDYGIIGNILREEYRFLRGFSQDLKAGMSEAQFKYRLGLYANSAYGSYERGRLESHIAAGYRWEKRIRGATESCLECIAYERLGWQPIGSLPNPTESCTCQANCKCSKQFSKTKPDNFLLSSKDGWLSLNLSLNLEQRNV